MADNHTYDTQIHGYIEKLIQIGKVEGNVTIQGSSTPFQAIADLPHFVGREQELQQLKEALLAGQHVTLYSLEGMGGVGKTVLAAHIAYQLRPRFPDGVLWARLDISDTMTILSVFAEAYGRDVSKYMDVESRSQVVREILADKRALIVLDNARYSEEITPLLPPTGTCAVIVTTRRRDLSATRGARRLYIEPFDRKRREALGLFARVLGEERVREESTLLTEIANLLGHLPLAIDIAACRLAYEPGWSTTDFLERVRQEKRRLDELNYEDLSVRVSFNLSYKALTPNQQQFFAAMGAFDGEDFSVEAAAYVTESSYEEAQDNLRKLYGLSLAQEGRPERYRLHPLLHDYAKERIVTASVFERAVEFFVQYAESHQTDDIALDLEISNLLAALQAAFNQGMRSSLIRLTNALSHFLEARGLYETAEIHLNRAQEAAKALGDKVGLAMVLLNLGRIEERRGDHVQADEYFREGLALARESGDRVTLSFLLGNLGWLTMSQGEYTRAEEYFREALSLAQESGDRERICTQLTHLGVVAHYCGNFKQTEELYREALALAREIGHRERICDLLINQGSLASHRRRYDEAEQCFQESLTLAREIGHRENVCSSLENMGELARKRRDYARAEALLRESLTLARELGQNELIVRSLRHLGKLSERCEQYTQAEEFCQEGLTLARKMRRYVDISAFLAILGTVATNRGDCEQAEACFEESLALAYGLEDPWLISDILNERGELYLKQQKLDSASAAFLEAIETAREVNAQELMGAALYGLARIEAVRGHIIRARRLCQESFDVLKAVDHYKVSEVAQWLETLPSCVS